MMQFPLKFVKTIINENHKHGKTLNLLVHFVSVYCVRMALISIFV